MRHAMKSTILRRLALVVASYLLAACAPSYNPSSYSSSSTTPGLKISAPAAVVALSGALQFTASGGVPPYSYSVSTANGGTISATGLYSAPAAAILATVVVTDASNSSALFNFTVESFSMSAATSIVNAGGTVQLTAINGIAPYVYTITTPATGGGSVSSTGLYTAPTSVAAPINVLITAIDANGDSATSSITVDPHVPVLSCTGNYNANLSTAPYAMAITENSATNTFTGAFAGSAITGTCINGTITFHFNAVPSTIYAGTYKVQGTVVVMSGTATFATQPSQSWGATSSTAAIYY